MKIKNPPSAREIDIAEEKRKTDEMWKEFQELGDGRLLTENYYRIPTWEKQIGQKNKFEKEGINVEDWKKKI